MQCDIYTLSILNGANDFNFYHADNANRLSTAWKEEQSRVILPSQILKTSITLRELENYKCPSWCFIIFLYRILALNLLYVKLWFSGL